jgi:hypothetical protein
MTNDNFKKISLRSAMVNRLMDEAECLIQSMGQTLDDEAWILQSLMNGLNYQRWNGNE